MEFGDNPCGFASWVFFRHLEEGARLDEVIVTSPSRPSIDEMMGNGARPIPPTVQSRRGAGPRLFRLFSIVGLLYIFLLSIGIIESGFKIAGQPLAEALISSTTNPFIGLFIGILATSLVQSSSMTTALVVTLVSAGTLSVGNAVPFIMGANIGTTVTATLVALGSVTRKEEFRRAFAAATVHDFFNVLTVLVLFPLEVQWHPLQKAAVWMTSLLGGVEGGTFNSPIKAILKPVAHALENSLLEGMGLGRGVTVIVMSGIGLVGLFISLIFISKVMRTVIAGASENVLRRAVGANIYLALIIGAVLTATVQSSSITTSLMVPLVGTGILQIAHVYPLMLGANMGTTVTALLASLTGNFAGITIALTHLCFNTAGILLFLPLPFMRWPIVLSTRFASWATDNRILAMLCVAGAFFGLPGLLILLTR
jgi:sodium-dependent phosphate cotransporter